MSKDYTMHHKPALENSEIFVSEFSKQITNQPPNYIPSSFGGAV
jgi:hypothetical protein